MDGILAIKVPEMNLNLRLYDLKIGRVSGVVIKANRKSRLSFMFFQKIVGKNIMLQINIGMWLKR